MKIPKLFLILILTSFFSVAVPAVLAQTKGLLTAEESFWLKERNNTIVVYPEQNNPPYSYQSPTGNTQGLSVDYIELIAEKIGAKIQYLAPRSRSQINSDIQNGKGDIAFFTSDKEKENYLIFTESYVTVPVVIVVRKDFETRSGLTMNDFNGKKVAMVQGSAIETYINTNYPRVVREGVTDDEVGLQQVVLGETDAAVMDVASLSFYLSKQVLSSVKVVGSTGLDHKPAFAMTEDKTVLQSILEKGLSQISANDRSLLNNKWIVLPNDTSENDNSFLAIIQNNFGVATLYILFGVGILTILILLITKKSHRERYFRRVHNVDELKEEFSELEGESRILSEELQEVKMEEQKLKGEIQSLEK
ncbi:MAG: Diguanylate cyclase with PAS/PAC sensor [Candidatus Nomurabacteria bacterium GW2011_GWF2_43_8]|uniref:Diguanylate cyclase with PAS/PAC sensor n=2 Tax=Candidatus Nomuraibacteriota TaxID=1752729 RepID=A0A0G1FQS0_9BACT|nr:MAG: Diguanylate cyclase with PAS/PAC sensor [Candidatus Nomurabacteria bacterium GW2011_GWB1_43_7]KKT24690.1 MAG: Diguanylate cyclase with PAS/PAC sensor [Candidatus Nomurabacteria bacterium GW2011_GWF2_43_8]